MTALTLHFAPNTCALVTMIALEHIGVDYRVETLAFARGDHRSATFLALNPKGAVPVLVIDGTPLTETVAIVTWLAARFPEAKLLSAPDDDLARAHILADLASCASGLHPVVTRLRIPHFFCDQAGSEGRVFELAQTAMHLKLAAIERRLGGGAWWYGERWSALDAYLHWVWFRITGTAFAAGDYPALIAHDARMRTLPPVQRAHARNEAIAAELAAQGLEIRFTGSGAVPAATR